MTKITLGIIGGGQLGSMMASSAKKLNIKTIIFSDDDIAPGQMFCDEFIFGDYDDINKVKEFTDKVDLVTFEFENIPYHALKKINEFKKVLPKPEVNKIIQNRLTEKDFINRLNIRTTKYKLIKNENDLKKNLTNLSQINKDIIIFESPKRIKRFLEVSRKIFKGSNLIIFKELTKINEKIILLKPEDDLPEINLNKGEFVIIIENKESEISSGNYNDEIIVDKLKELLDLNFTGKDSIKIASNYLGVNQKKIYNMYLNNFNKKQTK